MSPKATLVDGTTANPTVSFYGDGMRWDRDSRDVVIVGHSGGLPGFGSQYRFAPDYGVGVIAFSNLRYGPVYVPTLKVLNTLVEKAMLPARIVTPSAILTTRQTQVVNMIRSWDAGLAAAITADNFFLDRSRADWIEFAGKQLASIGKVSSIGALKAENQLRGSFQMVGEQGTLDVSFTLTPEREPKVQALNIKPVAKP
jgi:CubicO group peptidase (beta-lactamase class C family)